MEIREEQRMSDRSVISASLIGSSMLERDYVAIVKYGTHTKALVVGNATASSRNKDVQPEAFDWDGQSLSDRDNEQSFYSVYYISVRPLLIAAFLLGLLPLSMRKEGPKLSMLSLAYCATLYTLWMVYTALQVKERISFLDKGSFDEIVSFFRGIFYLSMHPFVPLVYWARARDMSRYVWRWMAFEARYRRVTDSQLMLGNQLLTLILAVVIVPVSLVFVVQQTASKPFFSLWSVPVNTYGLTMQMLLDVWWNCSFLSLLAASKALQFEMRAAIVQACLQRKTDGPQVVREFRALWLQLRALVQATGTVIYTAVLLHSALLFLKLTLCSYGLAARLVHPGYHLEEPVDMAINILLLVAETYLANHMAHLAFYHVGLALKEELESIMLKIDVPPDIIVEILMFGKTIQMNPPVISLGGYLLYNKQLLVSNLSTMVTYLIVLLQFRLSISRDTVANEPACGATSATVHNSTG